VPAAQQEADPAGISQKRAENSCFAAGSHTVLTQHARKLFKQGTTELQVLVLHRQSRAFSDSPNT
jgi:hypothetical protein